MGTGGWGREGIRMRHQGEGEGVKDTLYGIMGRGGGGEGMGSVYGIWSWGKGVMVSMHEAMGGEEGRYSVCGILGGKEGGRGLYMEYGVGEKGLRTLCMELWAKRRVGILYVE